MLSGGYRIEDDDVFIKISCQFVSVIIGGVLCAGCVRFAPDKVCV